MTCLRTLNHSTKCLSLAVVSSTLFVGCQDCNIHVSIIAAWSVCLQLMCIDLGITNVQQSRGSLRTYLGGLATRCISSKVPAEWFV